jgi:hypothetical protein
MFAGKNKDAFSTEIDAIIASSMRWLNASKLQTRQLKSAVKHSILKSPTMTLLHPAPLRWARATANCSAKRNRSAKLLPLNDRKLLILTDQKLLYS